MVRSLERKLLYVASLWQLLTGMITTFFYSGYIKRMGINMEYESPIERLGLESFYDSLFMFTISFGIVFMVIAVINYMLAKKVLKDGTLQYKMPIYLIGMAILFFILSDFISLSLFLTSAVITLARNKALKAYPKMG